MEAEERYREEKQRTPSAADAGKDGQVIGNRYRFLRMIGKGGTASVWLAEDLILKKKWAVKQSRAFGNEEKISGCSGGSGEVPLANEIHAGEQEMLAVCSLKKEAEILRKLSHPMIPGIRDVFEEGGRFYVVMDYVEGVTLEEYLKENGPAPEKTVRRWAIELCRVLYYLHTRKPPVIYRDLKPSNIMLSPDGQIRLIDFGIAREYRAGKHADTSILGTGGYAAPEQHGRRQSDARSDIYSLGITLRELLTGNPPLKKPGKSGRVSQKDTSGEVSCAMERILRRATAFHPDERYRDCRRMAVDLLQADRRIAAQRKRRMRKKLCLVTVGMAVALFLILGSIYLYTAGREKEKRYRDFLDFGTVTGVNEAIRQAEKAVRVDPDRREIYDCLLNYLEERKFSDSESRVFGRFWRVHRSGISDQKFYPELLLRIGKLYFYRYRGEDDSLRIRILRAEPFFGGVLSCGSAADKVRREGEIYETICSFCIRYMFDASLLREPQGEDYRRVVKALAHCGKEIEKLSGEEADYSKMTILSEMADILNTLRFDMAKKGVEKNRVRKLYQEMIQSARSLCPVREKSKMLRKELLENLSVYQENMERAYKNAKHQ